MYFHVSLLLSFGCLLCRLSGIAADSIADLFSKRSTTYRMASLHPTPRATRSLSRTSKDADFVDNLAARPRLYKYRFLQIDANRYHVFSVF